ncbi:MAG: alkaline phosphatase D family protein [Planctomycetota bacterium]|nr:alkaline phosphatase D family protein [Planctomycetota bacterium]
MTLRIFLQSLSVVLQLATSAALAQHDPQRNATQFVAAGQFDKADDELKKADDKDPETHFVKMLNSLGRKDIDRALQHAQAAMDRGLPFARLAAGPRDALAPLRETKTWQKWAEKHTSLNLLHGPMLGDVTDGSVDVWIRTRRPSKAEVVVFAADNDLVISRSEEKLTTLDSDLTTVLTVKRLRPQTPYRYTVLLDGEPVPMKLRTFTTVAPAGTPSKFRVAFGGGAGYVPEWEYMWDTILNEKPNALLMLGDNVYIDDPTQPLTQDYCYYRRQARPEWLRLVGSTPTYAIYDDHDFGTNDCVPGPDIFKPAWKPEVFKRFARNWVNPTYGSPKQPGCWFDFYIGDVHFIMLDGRYYRDRKGEPTMLGPVQRSWLFHTLKNSKGRFKVLASPVPWTVGIKPGSKDPWDGFPEERELIFSFIEKNKINGLFLIAADRHRTDLRVTKRESGFGFVEFESSKLTNRHTHPVVKTDGLVWGYNKKCSFALMKFDTTVDDPVVQFEAITIDGEKVHSHELRLSEITHK